MIIYIWKGSMKYISDFREYIEEYKKIENEFYK